MLFFKSLSPLRLGRCLRLKNSAGMSLVEIMVAIGLVGIAAAAGSQLLPRIGETRKRIESISLRDGISMRVKKALTANGLRYSATTYAASDTGNAQLRNCIDGLPATICTATDIINPQSFRLALPGGGATPIDLAGSDRTPLFYDVKGQRCPNNLSASIAANCKWLWDVRSYFVAICQNNAASCPDAFAVRVRNAVSFVPDPDRPYDPIIASLPPVDTGPSPDPWRLSYWVPIQPPTQTTACAVNSNTVMSGASATGVVICTCLPGTTPTGVDADGNPICTPPTSRTCPSGQKMQGLDQNALPRCVPKTAETCSWLSSAAANCTGYVAQTAMGASTVPTTYKKGAPDVTCAANRYLCCT